MSKCLNCGAEFPGRGIDGLDYCQVSCRDAHRDMVLIRDVARILRWTSNPLKAKYEALLRIRQDYSQGFEEAVADLPIPVPLSPENLAKLRGQFVNDLPPIEEFLT